MWFLFLWLNMNSTELHQAPGYFDTEADCVHAGELIKGYLDSDPILAHVYPKIHWMFECRQEK